MSERTLLLGLIGDDIALSRTPPMHEAEGLAQGRPTIYRRLDTLRSGLKGRPLAEILHAARDMGFDGLNITHPHKRAVVELLDEIDDDVRRLGAANTVVIREDGTLVGHNTDVSGFRSGFLEGLPDAETGTVMQIGTGGAGTSVASALVGMGVQRLLVSDLDPVRAQELVASLNRGAGRQAAEALPQDQLEPALQACDGVVNATPMGMPAHPGTSFDTGLLSPRQWVAEIVYMPLRTQLLEEAAQRGCRTLDGGRMAVFQAVDAFRHFTGLEPDVQRMREAFLLASS